MFKEKSEKKNILLKKLKLILLKYNKISCIANINSSL